MSIYKKLNEFKKRVGAIKKDSTNPHYKNKYASIESVLDTIEKPLLDAGLGFIQCVEDLNLITTIYDTESDNILTSKIPLILNKNDMQQLGSAITYYRRYSLVSLLGLQAIDDDANLSVDKNDNRKVEPSKTVEKKPEPIEEIVLTEKHPKWLAVCKAVETGKKTVEEIADYYKCSEYIIGVLNMVSGKGEAVEVK